MSEQRKPSLILFAQKMGQKKYKVEFFKATDFLTYSEYKRLKGRGAELYRLRVNGRWFPKGQKRFYNYIQCIKLFDASIRSLGVKTVR